MSLVKFLILNISGVRYLKTDPKLQVEKVFIKAENNIIWYLIQWYFPKNSSIQFKFCLESNIRCIISLDAICRKIGNFDSNFRFGIFMDVEYYKTKAKLYILH